MQRRSARPDGAPLSQPHLFILRVRGRMDILQEEALEGICSAQTHTKQHQGCLHNWKRFLRGEQSLGVKNAT